jgi:hypothetical protein
MHVRSSSYYVNEISKYVYETHFFISTLPRPTLAALSLKKKPLSLHACTPTHTSLSRPFNTGLWGARRKNNMGEEEKGTHLAEDGR